MLYCSVKISQKLLSYMLDSGLAMALLLTSHQERLGVGFWSLRWFTLFCFKVLDNKLWRKVSGMVSSGAAHAAQTCPGSQLNFDALRASAERRMGYGIQVLIRLYICICIYICTYMGIDSSTSKL